MSSTSSTIAARLAAFALAIAAITACGSDRAGITEPSQPKGNYVTLQSDRGDWIGGGKTYGYTQRNSVVKVTATAAHVSVQVTGDEWWYGDFDSVNGISALTPGSYDYGASWWGEGRGCTVESGTFTLDTIRFVAGQLTAVDIRFAQRCQGNTGSLHGTIHWRSDDTSQPPGPVLPVPSGLWQPPAGSTPSSGSYLIIRTEADAFGAPARTYAYSDSATSITVRASAGHLLVGAGGWTGDFQTMNTVSQILPGFYGDLQRYPFHNPAKGGLAIYGNGTACDDLAGWFAVDHVTYVGGALTELDLRFEQRCSGSAPVLHGALHWRA